MRNATIAIVAAAAAALAATTAVADDKHHGAAAAAAQSSAPAEFADGEVRRLDKQAGKVTLKHGEIRNLEMPPMTMAFRVKDPTMLDRLSVGDKVRFTAEHVDGNYVVTGIEAVK
jgi:Cu/Ag efflux protein CusF